MALEDRKRHRDIVPVPVIESEDRVAARSVIPGQPLKALLEADNRPSFPLQPTRANIRKVQQKCRSSIPTDDPAEFRGTSRSPPCQRRTCETLEKSSAPDRRSQGIFKQLLQLRRPRSAIPFSQGSNHAARAACHFPPRCKCKQERVENKSTSIEFNWSAFWLPSCEY